MTDEVTCIFPGICHIASYACCFKVRWCQCLSHLLMWRICRAVIFLSELLGCFCFFQGCFWCSDQNSVSSIHFENMPMISLISLPLLYSVLLFMQLTNSSIIQPNTLSSKFLKMWRHAVRDFSAIFEKPFQLKLIKFKITPQHPLNCSEFHWPFSQGSFINLVEPVDKECSCPWRPIIFLMSTGGVRSLRLQLDN